MVRPRVGFHEACLNRFLDFIEQFCDRTDTNLFRSVFGSPDRQRRSPITGTREVPIVEVIQPLTETTGSGRFWLPVDGLVEGNHLITRHGRFNEPRVQRIIDDRFVRSPAMRITMHMFLCLQQTTIRFHLQAEMQIKALIFFRQRRIIGILDESTCVLTIQFRIDVSSHPCFIQVFDLPILTGEIDHRTGSVVLRLHVKTRYTGSIANLLIVRTERRCDMYDTSTVFGCDIVTRDDTERTRSRIHPGEERIIFEANKVRTLVTRYDLSILEIRTQTCFG